MATMITRVPLRGSSIGVGSVFGHRRLNARRTMTVTSIGPAYIGASYFTQGGRQMTTRVALHEVGAWCACARCKREQRQELT